MRQTRRKPSKKRAPQAAGQAASYLRRQLRNCGGAAKLLTGLLMPHFPGAATLAAKLLRVRISPRPFFFLRSLLFPADLPFLFSSYRVAGCSGYGRHKVDLETSERLSSSDQFFGRSGGKRFAKSEQVCFSNCTRQGQRSHMIFTLGTSRESQQFGPHS